MKSRIGFLVAIFFISLPVFAQRRQLPKEVTYPTELTAQLEKLRDAAMQSDYAYKQLAHLSHNIGPRLSGSAGAAKAVEYVTNEMRKLGADVKLEKVMVPHWVRGAETGELVTYPGQAPNTPQKVVLTALGGSIATPVEGVTASVIVAHSFNELKAMGKEKVAGKIVLWDVKYDKKKSAAGHAFEAYGEAVVYRGSGASAAARLGAVASLVRSVGSADYRLPHTGFMGYAPDAPKIPGAAVTAEDAEMIADLATQGDVKMHLVLTPQTLPDAESFNIIADFKGTEHPEQIIIVSGHLDSWDLGTGSIDDGSGIVHAMQTLQLVKQMGWKPKRTIRFIAWMSEENSGNGGVAYAKDYADQIKDHVAAIESDSGNGHALGIVASTSADGVKYLQPLANVLASIGANIVTKVEGEVGSDIEPLQTAGVPGFAPSNDGRTYFHYHHTPADTFDKIDPREMQENCAVMATLAWTLANTSEVFPR